MTDAPPSEFWQGIDLFNQQEFYACHDILEALWMEAMEPDKTFYQGILQIAVALYHLENHNWQGAVILLGEGSNRLRRYPATYSEIDVDRLLTDSAALLTTLQQTGAEAVATIAASLQQACSETGSNPTSGSTPEDKITLPPLKILKSEAES